MTTVRSQSVGFVLDPTIPTPDNITKAEMLQIKSGIRGIIIANIFKQFHKQVSRINEPKAVLKRLEKLLEPTGPLQEYALTQHFGNMLYNPTSEKAIRFPQSFR